MKTHLEELEDNRVRLTVEVPADDVDHAFDHALSDLSQSVRLPGFRKGKAPKGLVMQRLGRDAIIEEALEHHLSGWYRRAVAVAGIDPVDRPTIDWADQPAEGNTFSFQAEVAVKPRPEVKAYKGLTGVRAPVDVPREAIDGELERLRTTVAELNPVSRPAQNGDFVVIDFAGSIGGEEFEGGKEADYSFELGAGRLIEDLEKGLLGMSTGEERDVPVTFPADYPAEHLAGQEASFHIVMKDVKERVLPDPDDELAKSVSEFDTMAELEGDISKRFEEIVQQESDRLFRSTVLDDLAKQLTTELPEALVRSRMAEMTRDMINSLASRGIEMSDYLRLTGQTADQIVEALRPQAEDSVAKDLALEAVADAEGIDITDEMVESFIREQATQGGDDPDDTVSRLMADPATLTALRIDLRLQKALDIAADNAKEMSPEQAEAREKLWTPEKESEGAAAKPSTIWTPGSAEPG
ncbi:MAG: trigger factor [Gaiellales bacterium]|jgi:trigger factor|nr:trigger factor [Gaiellales bacterium]